ncbi:hypothetical protein TSIB_0688 [Thermococcus sibiricus MM 739]|uniref:Uncharacterized protein n=1 Tax=Thermococcus sibiricus (strain DSM 12597 / MM 739) TaxID=604354 RepID=C6A2A8_THESM|nr:hypothetical protein TSIB_0688 [Thermococcus sibiricus MM 739]
MLLFKGIKARNRLYSSSHQAPWEKWVKPTREEIINMAFQAFAEAIGRRRLSI